MSGTNNKKPWTREENHIFEQACYEIPENAPDRYQKMAVMLPGRTQSELIERYIDLEGDMHAARFGYLDLHSGVAAEWTAQEITVLDNNKHYHDKEIEKIKDALAEIGRTRTIKEIEAYFEMNYNFLLGDKKH